MSLYTSILADEADHHEQMLQNLGYKSQQQPLSNSATTGSLTTSNHKPEIEVKPNQEPPKPQTISKKNVEPSTPSTREASLALRKDDPGDDVDDDLEPPVSISTSRVKLSDYLDNIHPPSVPSSDSDCSDNDSDSPPKIFERPNLNYLNWTDFL